LKNNFDYIIAGGGSAGCTLASRLAEDSSISVLLIEAGGSGKSLFTKMPGGNGFIIGNPKFDWVQYSTPQPNLNNRKIFYPRGKGLGGSSLLNGMIYMRGGAGDFNRWRQKGLEGWSYEKVLPYFKKSVSAYHRENSKYHGQNGPLKITPAGNYSKVDEIFVKACEEAGAIYNDDFNGEKLSGVGKYDVKVWKGIRQSSSEAYLKTKPKNLTIFKNTHVINLIIEKSKAIGLNLSSGKVYANCEIILSLGAFGSPKCLMLSGIGPENHLKEHGIKVVNNLPGVGENFYDHPIVPMNWAFKNPKMSLAKYQRIDKAILLGLNYIFFKKGLAAAPFWSTNLFHSLREDELPELQIFMTAMCFKEEPDNSSFNLEKILNIGSLFFSRGKKASPGMHFQINLLRPKSTGTVKLKSSNPKDEVLINPNWFSDPLDMNDMVEGMKHMRKVISQPSFKNIVGEEIQPGNNFKNDFELKEAVRNFVQTGHHPASTCAMGSDNNVLAVLDEKLRVKGIKNLRVVDASSFPDMISGNINASVIMIAEKAADMILGKEPLETEKL
tara:strand:+ start:819 stop:2480 length:1662 start_codon:yes stop_codon:yes gene_type:complete